MKFSNDNLPPKKVKFSQVIDSIKITEVPSQKDKRNAKEISKIGIP